MVKKRKQIKCILMSPYDDEFNITAKLQINLSLNNLI